MNHADFIVKDLAHAVCERISRKVIRELQGMTNENILSLGESTGLKTVWDEMCVKEQGDGMICSSLEFVWEDTIRGILGYYVESLAPYEAQAVTLQTNEGMELEEEREAETRVPICDEAIEDYILKEYILCKALDWSNSRIRRYLGEE